MKKFLHQLLMLTKHSLYGFIIQLFLCTALFAIDSNAQNSMNLKEVQISSLKFNDVYLEEALALLEVKSGFHFTYNKYDLQNVRVKGAYRNQSLYAILLNLSEQASIKFKQVNKNITVKLIEEEAGQNENRIQIVNQQTEVSGKVTSADNGEALPGVNVVEKGTSNGTVTDVEGNYALAVTSGATLIFSSVGFTSEEISVNNRSVIDVAMITDVKQLQELVVVGYGTQEKSLVTGSISSVQASDIENMSVSRAEQALQGKTAGIQVLPASGSPGAGMKVRIRGAGTNGNANPLYIVDGIKATDINYLAPEDIASMEVLKDGAASAIYGAEGGNGVVIITTKSGEEGVSKVNYSFQYGNQSVGDLPDLMNGEQYSQYMSEAGATVSGSANTDWLDEIFETAPMQKHHLSFTGGSEATKIFTSLAYYDQDGVLGGDKANFKRITGRVNLDHSINNWLDIGTNISYTNTNRASIEEDDEFDGLLAAALSIDPLTPTHMSSIPDFLSAVDPNLLRRDANGQYFAISRNIQGEAVNPLLGLDISRGSTKTDRVFGNFYVDIKPIKNVTFTSRVGIDYAHGLHHFWSPTYYYSSERNNSSTGVSDETTTLSKWQWENFITYNTDINNHSIGLVAGTSAEQLRFRTLDASTTGMFVEDDLFSEHAYTSSNTGSVSGNLFEEKLLSYFGRVSYDFMNRYMFNATLRFDGASTSLLSADNNWGAFPSVSAGWAISEEPFFPQGFISFAKLRASWGQNGSLANLRSVWVDYDDFSPFNEIEGKQFIYLSSITSQGIRYPLPGGGFIVGSEPSVLPNPDLTWETSEQINYGIDLEAMQGRLSFSVDYYTKLTKDLLAIFAAPAAAGNNPPFLNAGDVRNSGLEFDLGIRNNTGPFTYSLNANLATQKNEVKSLRANVPRIVGMRAGTNWREATSFEEGEPIWYFRGYQTNGINETTGQPNYVDIDGDGAITPADQGKIGSPHPNLIYGGSISLGYQNFDLNVFVQGVSGNDILLGWIRTDRPTANKPAFFYENRWTESNRNASMPRPFSAGGDIRPYQSDLMVRPGGYMRVKQIQLGYRLPQTLLNPVGISAARIYFSLDDYFTFTKYEGMDPEAGSAEDSSLGVDRGVYPLPRKMMFGLSVSF